MTPLSMNACSADARTEPTACPRRCPPNLYVESGPVDRARVTCLFWQRTKCWARRLTSQHLRNSNSTATEPLRIALPPLRCHFLSPPSYVCSTRLPAAPRQVVIVIVCAIIGRLARVPRFTRSCFMACVYSTSAWLRASANFINVRPDVPLPLLRPRLRYLSPWP